MSLKAVCRAAAVGLLLAFVAGPMGVRPAAGSGRPVAPELVVGPAAAATPDVEAPGLPAADHARGVVWTGLRPATPGGPCVGGFEGTAAGRVFCTHGPDPAPPGIDVRTRGTVEELAAATSELATASTTTSGVPCYGDGSSGKRFEVIYARAADVADRYSTLAGMFPQWVANADKAYADSAAETGGVRHVRWLTDAACNLIVTRVQLSTNGDNSFSATVNELWGLGFNRTDRKYLVLVDANVYCGVGDIDWDDRAIETNYNNVGPSFARVDRGCWGQANSVEAHETMHGIGGVQNTAPHTTNGHHCTDDYDRMCYDDGSVGVVMTYPCASTHERLFDCNHDDYFHTAPPASNYLATHWNAAMNGFLEFVEPAVTTTTTAPPSPTTTVVSTSTTTTVPAPPGPVTDTFANWVSKRSPSRSFSVSTGAGTLSSRLTFSGPSPTLTLTVKAPGGAVVGQRSGASPVSLDVAVAQGTYTVTVNQTGTEQTKTSFTLTETHPA